MPMCRPTNARVDHQSPFAKMVVSTCCYLTSQKHCPAGMEHFSRIAIHAICCFRQSVAYAHALPQIASDEAGGPKICCLAPWTS
jgi:hypothetical protein